VLLSSSMLTNGLPKRKQKSSRVDQRAITSSNSSKSQSPRH
ncbi:uncharacterized protein METZ01_LOCUS256926, partial [marine metagenome]